MPGAPLLNAIQERLSKVLNLDVRLIHSSPVGGGCINRCFQLHTDQGDFFLKVNDKDQYPEMFAKEFQGLELLRSSQTILIPKPILTGDFGDSAFLVTEYLAKGSAGANFWPRFANLLAEMHRKTADHFGLDTDNYIGSLVQTNTFSDSWTDFFIERRLKPQIEMAAQAGLLDQPLRDRFENLFPRLERYFPQETPALLHGDLWSGNYLVTEHGHAALVDPAVYYGHREAEIAFTRLFGGFSAEFYCHYQDVHPMEEGYEQRFDLYNLYPLLVHVNLFGTSYLGGIRQTLAHYSG